MKYIKSTGCVGCFNAKVAKCVVSLKIGVIEPVGLERPGCYSDQHVLDKFNAQSYIEKTPKPFKAKMTYSNEDITFSKDVKIAPYISLGKRDPAILYEGNTAATHLSSLWRCENLAFTLEDGRRLAGPEIERELYK